MVILYRIRLKPGRGDRRCRTFPQTRTQIGIDPRNSRSMRRFQMRALIATNSPGFEQKIAKDAKDRLFVFGFGRPSGFTLVARNKLTEFFASFATFCSFVMGNRSTRDVPSRKSDLVRRDVPWFSQISNSQNLGSFNAKFVCD